MIGLAPEVSCAVHTFTRHFPDTDAVGRGLPPLEGSAATKFDRSRLSKPWLGWVVGIPLYLRRGVARLGRADIRGRRTRQILVRRLGPRDDGLKSPRCRTPGGAAGAGTTSLSRSPPRFYESRPWPGQVIRAFVSALSNIFCTKPYELTPNDSETRGFVPVVDGLGRDIGKTRCRRFYRWLITGRDHDPA